MNIHTAVVGLGKVFHRSDKFKRYSHCTSLLTLQKNFKIIYAIDPIKKRRLIAEKYFNCKTHDDLNILKNKRIDFLVICSPTSSHLKTFLKLLKILKKTPKIILFEKPVGLTVKQSKKIKQICKQKKIIAFVNYFRDYEEKFIKIKKIFNKYSIGYVEFSGNYKNNSSHFVSLFISIFGKPTKVKIINKKKTMKDYIVDFKLNFKNNNVCYFKNTYYKKNHHFFKLYNKKKFLTFNNFNQTLNIQSDKKNKFEKIQLSPNFNNVYKNVINYFNKRKYCLSSIENAIEVHKILSICQKK